MRKDHRPYFVKKAFLIFQKWYVDHRLMPHFEYLGKSCFIAEPWHVDIFGSPIRLGDYANMFATSDHKVRFCVWSQKQGELGRIDIGKYCLISPGVRISSSHEIIIGDSCMLASNVYITDADWHDIYNRVDQGRTSPVHLHNNVWIGDSAILCKGITIGQNSIVGAGSVVVHDVPENTIVAGNPAKVVKTLDGTKNMITRAHWFSNPDQLFQDVEVIEKDMLKDNSFIHWLRTLIYPKKGD